MKLSVLERLMSVNHHRRKMYDVGMFSSAIAIRFPSGPEEGPWITSMTSGKYTLTRPDREGCVGQALHECMADEEDGFLGELYRSVWQTSAQQGWNNRCSSIGAALQRMTSYGLEPRNLVVPFGLLKEVVGTELSEEEADKLSLTKGCVAEVNGVQVISARQALPGKGAILATARPLVGHYTRVYDRVGVTILQANRTLVLVGEDAD